MLPVIDDLQIPGIVDVHSHFMPHSVMSKVWEVFDNAESVYGVPWPVAYRGDDEQRLTQLREFGVVAFTSLVYAHKPGMAAWLNNWCAEFAHETAGCLQTATFFPEPGVAEYVEHALADGARVFKIHLQVGAFDPRDESLTPVWSMLAEQQVPTVVHCGSGPLPGPFTGPGPMGEVMDRHPDLPVIIAHMGAPEYREFLEFPTRYENAYLDTTMSFTPFMDELAPFPADLRDQLLEIGLRGRILFGSDFPNIPYSYQAAVDALLSLELGDDWLRQVLYGAGAKLFKLGIK